MYSYCDYPAFPIFIHEVSNTCTTCFEFACATRSQCMDVNLAGYDSDLIIQLIFKHQPGSMISCKVEADTMSPMSLYLRLILVNSSIVNICRLLCEETIPFWVAGSRQATNIRIPQVWSWGTACQLRHAEALCDIFIFFIFLSSFICFRFMIFVFLWRGVTWR